MIKPLTKITVYERQNRIPFQTIGDFKISADDLTLNAIYLFKNVDGGMQPVCKCPGSAPTPHHHLLPALLDLGLQLTSLLQPLCTCCSVCISAPHKPSFLPFPAHHGAFIPQRELPEPSPPPASLSPCPVLQTSPLSTYSTEPQGGSCSGQWRCPTPRSRGS